MKTFKAIFLCSMFCLFFSCGSKEDKLAKTHGLLPKAKQSKHFADVTKHLDIGGTIFTYVDIDGDIQKGFDFLDTLFKGVSEKIPSAIIKAIDLKILFAKLGFENIDAFGMSSYKEGQHFHNKFFIHHTGKRRGLMKMFDGPTKSLAITYCKVSVSLEL